MNLAEQLVRTSPRWPIPTDGHCFIKGKSGFGKSGLVELMARAALADRRRALIAIDPEGELTPHLVEFTANPANGVCDRVVHLLQPASRTETFGLGLLDVSDRDPQACHQAAVRTRTILEQVADFGTSEYGPRLSKMLHLGAFALALTGRPLVALPEIYTTAAMLRSTLGEAFPFEFMSEEWRALDVLADRSPRQFIDYRDALMSRMMPLFGSPILRRIFGQESGRNIDVSKILRGREVVLLDLSGLESKDAILVGTSLFSLVYDAALKSPITSEAIASIILEEAADYLTPDVLRSLDRCRKRGVFLIIVCQRLAQFIKPDDPAATVLSAVLTNCLTDVSFGGLAPDDAELIVRRIFTGHVQLDTVYKPGSVRPVAVGNDKVTLSSQAAGRHHLEQSAEGSVNTRSESRVRALTDASATNWAAMNFSGNGAGASSHADGTLLSGPTPISLSHSRNSGRGRGAGGGRTRGRMSGFQSGTGHATTKVAGRADGFSAISGTHDAFVTRYENLATETFTLEEKLHALTGLLMNLPPRSCFVKIGAERPVLTRTPDLMPAFRSENFKRQILPLYLARLGRSAYLRPSAEVDAEIARYLAALARPDIIDADFSEPEPARLPRGDNES